MQIQASAGSDRLRIVDRDRSIGFVDGSTIVFHGFPTPGAAARAAWAAHQAVLFRRTGVKLHPGEGAGFLTLEPGGEHQVIAAGSRPIARLPALDDPATPRAGWGFAMGLSPDDDRELRLNSAEVFLRSRARVMWRAIRAAGLDRGRHPDETF